jgi:hypothetical protein
MLIFGQTYTDVNGFEDALGASIQNVHVQSNLPMWSPLLSSHPLRPNKKNMCIYGHMSKNLGSVGINFLIFFLLLAKPEIFVLGSEIRFRYFIFEISGKPSFV